MLNRLYSRHQWTFLLGFNRDKDIQGFLDCFERTPDRVITTAAPSPRAMPPDELAALLMSKGWPATRSALPEALDLALEGADPKTLIVATGSLYLAGAVRSDWLRRTRENTTFLSTKESKAQLKRGRETWHG